MTRYCAYPPCGQSFVPPPAAPHKKFCCGRCRDLARGYRLVECGSPRCSIRFQARGTKRFCSVQCRKGGVSPPALPKKGPSLPKKRAKKVVPGHLGATDRPEPDPKTVLEEKARKAVLERIREFDRKPLSEDDLDALQRDLGVMPFLHMSSLSWQRGGDVRKRE